MLSLVSILYLYVYMSYLTYLYIQYLKHTTLNKNIIVKQMQFQKKPMMIL